MAGEVTTLSLSIGLGVVSDGVVPANAFILRDGSVLQVRDGSFYLLRSAA